MAKYAFPLLVLEYFRTILVVIVPDTELVPCVPHWSLN